ncbi:MAG: flavin reductase family protein [Planctomycetes bacterium]|nr:flavin reductase family protein [Planctomycetota bacterium]
MDSSSNPELAAALGRIPSGLFIVTVRSGTERTAFLASWVQQCAFDPPMLSICVKRGRPAEDMLREGEVLTVNILRTGAGALMKPFAKGVPPGADPYVGVETEGPFSGAEVLKDALASIDARVQARSDAGDHVLLLAEVLAGRVHGEGGEPWVHVRRNGFSY